MRHTYRKFMQIPVVFVHPTVQPALLDIKRLHQFPVLASFLSLPNFLKGLGVEIPDADSLIEQMR
jgi:hypothetical protein